jgi:hypothetical protein
MNLKIEHLCADFKKYRKKSKGLDLRLRALIELAKRRSNFATSYSNLDFELVGETFDKSGRTIQRWMDLYLAKGVRGLTPKTHSNRKREVIKGWIAAKITDYRTLYNWGAETIQAHLALDHLIILSKYKINAFLKEKKLIKLRRKKKLKNRHTTIVVVETPGAHTQTDVKHLPKILKNNLKAYVYNFVDHASRWEYKEAFDSYCPFNTKKFFNNVLAAAPFEVVCSQTDNGVEFTNKFISRIGDPTKNCYEEFLEEKKIYHRLIPPGEKELNGLVERSHRADDEELYHRIQPLNLKELNKFLKEHCRWRNEERRKKPLEWKTTSQWLWDYQLQRKDKPVKLDEAS